MPDWGIDLIRWQENFHFDSMEPMPDIQIFYEALLQGACSVVQMLLHMLEMGDLLQMGEMDGVLDEGTMHRIVMREVLVLIGMTRK